MRGGYTCLSDPIQEAVFMLLHVMEMNTTT